jgi:hypothetical protein
VFAEGSAARSIATGGVSVVGRAFPVLVIGRQIDWHVHFLQEYAIGGSTVFARWKFVFTAPCLVDAEKPQDLNEQDFAPGGIAALVETGIPSEVRYDVPFGTETHPNARESFITAVTHAFLSQPQGGVLVASKTGSQSFRVCGRKGEIAVVFGRSATSGGRRKLGFHVGSDVFDVKAEAEWYKEPFYGEYTHDFVIHPFSGDWREQCIPVKGRAAGDSPGEGSGFEPADRQPFSGHLRRQYQIGGLREYQRRARDGWRVAGEHLDRAGVQHGPEPDQAAGSGRRNPRDSAGQAAGRGPVEDEEVLAAFV